MGEPEEFTDKAWPQIEPLLQVVADRVADGGINRLKQWLGIATRFDRRAVNSRVGVPIVSLLLWLA